MLTSRSCAVALGSLLLAGNPLGCSKSQQEREANVVQVEPQAGTPAAWIARANALYREHAGERTEREAFARIRFELTPTLEGTEYVRVHRSGTEIEFLPHCSVLAGGHLLDEIHTRGPWQLLDGELQAGQTLRATNAQEGQLLGRVEFVEAAGWTAQRIWDDWLYARSVAVAFAATQGYDVAPLGKQSCSPGANLGVCEAERATEGNPLAALRGVLSCSSSYISKEECDRGQTLNPVRTGAFQNFCGRINPALIERNPNTEMRRTATARARELQGFGLDVPRLLRGSALVASNQHYPQLNLFELVGMIQQLDLVEPMSTEFRALANAPDVDLANRFRAHMLDLYLHSNSGNSKLLEELQMQEFGRFIPLCDPGTTTCSPTDADRRCASHLIGGYSLSCAHG